jgi:hypothetical protein
MDRDLWTAETVKAGLSRFYHEIAGVGLVFPRESSLGWTPPPSTPPSKSGHPPLPSPFDWNSPGDRRSVPVLVPWGFEDYAQVGWQPRVGDPWASTSTSSESHLQVTEHDQRGLPQTSVVRRLKRIDFVAHAR